jgi:hypothetical protein
MYIEGERRDTQKKECKGETDSGEREREREGRERK